LLGNDTDVDGDTLSIASVTSGTGGSAVLNADGTVTFTPDAGFTGPATFTYTVTDGSAISNTATVTVDVNAKPVANDDTPVDLGATKGLYSEYFEYRQNIDGPNLDYLHQAVEFIEGKTSDITFNATTLNYNPDSLFNNNLGAGK